MKKLMIGLAAAVVAFASQADYKTIELQNGTNEVQVNGALLPVAIEVKSTESNRLVTVDRASDVDILRKCYDITTNDVSWDEAVVTTNDYFIVRSDDAVQIASQPCGSSPNNYLINNGSSLLCKGSPTSYYFSDTSLKSPGVAIDLSEMKTGTSTPLINAVCYGNSGFACLTGDGLGWSDNGTTFHPAVSQPEEFGRIQTAYSFGCSMAFGHGRYFATAHWSNSAGTEYTVKFAESTDGRNWTDVTSLTGLVYSIHFCNGTFFAHGSDARGFSSIEKYTSTDGVNWQPLVIPYCTFTGVTYAKDRYVLWNTETIWHSSDIVHWVEVPKMYIGSSSTINKVAYMSAIDAFIIAFSDSLYISKDLAQDWNSYERYYGLQNVDISGTIEPATNGYVYIASGTALSLYGKQKDRMFAKGQASGQRDEAWTNGVSEISYSASFGDPWLLYDHDRSVGVSSPTESRPASVTFPHPCSWLTTDAYVQLSRVTNYVHHEVYEYVTNRIYYVIDSKVTKTARIVDARCVDGISSQDVTNRVFLINGDRLVVDGIEVSDVESTKATLICE